MQEDSSTLRDSVLLNKLKQLKVGDLQIVSVLDIQKKQNFVEENVVTHMKFQDFVKIQSKAVKKTRKDKASKPRNKSKSQKEAKRQNIHHD